MCEPYINTIKSTIHKKQLAGTQHDYHHKVKTNFLDNVMNATFLQKNKQNINNFIL